MALKFAGVPLCAGDVPAHPDVQSILEWIEVNIRMQNVFPLDIETWNGISSFSSYGPDKPIRPQVLYWPVGSTRWAHMHVPVTQDILDEIRKKAPDGRGTLELTWYDASADPKGTLLPTMTLLPAKPISENTGDGWFLLTFVDDRYHWWRQQTPRTGESTSNVTWQTFFTSLASNLGISVTQDTVASVYSNPQIFIPAAVEFAPCAMDMACFYFGHRLTRSLNGNCFTRTPENSKNDADDNASIGEFCRAGGQFTLRDLHFTLPSYIKLLFPRNDGDLFTENTTTAGPYSAMDSGTVAKAGPSLVALSVPPLAGITGNGKTKELLTTYEADYITGSPANQLTMDTLLAQMASDWYMWSMLLYDQKWTGILALDPDAFHDIEWTYRGDEVSTRMIPFLYEGLFFYHMLGDSICGEAEVHVTAQCCTSFVGNTTGSGVALCAESEFFITAECCIGCCRDQSAKIYDTTTQSITAGATTALTADSEEWDTDAFHSTSSNTNRIVFTTAGAGKYHIDWNFQVSVSFGAGSTPILPKSLEGWLRDQGGTEVRGTHDCAQAFRTVDIIGQDTFVLDVDHFCFQGSTDVNVTNSSTQWYETVCKNSTDYTASVVSYTLNVRKLCP